MSIDRIDRLQKDWCLERPDLDPSNMGVVLRIQMMAKLMNDHATAALEGLGLEWWEYDVLSTLRRQSEPFEMNASALAEATMLTTGAMTNRVDRQVSRGFVSRRHDLKDRRRVLVRLTRKGRQLVDRATEARFGAADSMLEAMPSANREQLSHLLRELVISTASTSPG